MSIKTNSSKGILFTSGSLPKAILLFAAPNMLGILLQNLYGAVDLFVVGHYAATADVSAVTIGSQLMSIITNLVIGLVSGTTVLIGQARGADDKRSLSRITGSSILMFSLCAVILTGIYLIFNPQLVLAMQTPEEAVQATRQYLLACAIGIPFIVGYNVVTSILTGLGDSKTPFLFIAIACVINIVLDIVLVRYFSLGALGAAIATTAAQAGSLIFSVLFLKIKGLGFTLSKKDVRFNKAQIGRISKIGCPVAVQNVMVGISFLFVTAIINKMGLTASAAVGVVEKLITFLFVPATAFGVTVGTACAQNLGAMKFERAKKSMWWGIFMSLIPSVIILIFCQFKGNLLTGILTNDSNVISIAAQYLKSYIFDIILVCFVFCMNGYFNSCGKSWFSLVHSLTTTFAARIPLAYLFSRLPNTNLFLIGWAAPISTLISVIMCFIFLLINRKNDNKKTVA